MVRDRTADTQQGFVKGRNFGQRALTLDSEARKAGRPPDAPYALPILVSFDMTDTFPSLRWEFLFASLVAHGAPPGDLKCHPRSLSVSWGLGPRWRPPPAH
eukprot:2637782-Pyramimonas_sp.AAC.1